MSSDNGSLAAAPAAPGLNGSANGHTRKLEQVESVTIRFVGDSGDGMQLAGTQFTNTSALLGNDIATFPDFPAEIRAPAGTLAGVSGFQVHFSSSHIYTPGDDLDAAARLLAPGGLLAIRVPNRAGVQARLSADMLSRSSFPLSGSMPSSLAIPGIADW